MNRKLLLPLAAAFLGVAAPAVAHNGVIHEAPHGGIMKPVGKQHLEIVLAPAGGVRIYLNDGASRPLPASAASELSVEIDRPGTKTEYVAMRPDPSNSLWTGASRPVTNSKSIVRIGTVVAGAPALIEVPRAQFPTYAAKGRPARAR